MVFSSIPAYLDPSSNWQQQPNNQSGGGGSSTQLNQFVPITQPAPPPLPQPPPPPQPHVSGCIGGGIRPGSMAERARLANIPMPEATLKCPRCESTNTKFCYFNNYSLSQPRHFCKTCRRYWTRGGALRSVPVGGGCRRNKRTKAGSSSKSPVSSDRQTTSSSTGTVSSNSTGAPGNLVGLTFPQNPPLRFLSPLGQLTDHYNNSGDIGLSYSGLSSPMVGACEANFQNNLLGGIGGGGLGSLEQWRLQQFPFLGGGGLDSSSGLYQFQGSQFEASSFIGETSHHVRPKASSSLLASVKMEENQGLNFSRQLMGISGNDPWTGAAWADLPSFSSSSTTNPL